MLNSIWMETRWMEQKGALQVLMMVIHSCRNFILVAMIAGKLRIGNQIIMLVMRREQRIMNIQTSDLFNGKSCFHKHHEAYHLSTNLELRDISMSIDDDE
mmetsp:Transcript_21556/g.26458  ORF Transcript_21556/g.26458 Transcript_21556/m.26458 type:complete len:100 (-) Transcript_21556:4-303(-)